MKEKEDQLIIRSSKESIYMCVCGCCMLVFLAFLCKGDVCCLFNGSIGAFAYDDGKQ